MVLVTSASHHYPQVATVGGLLLSLPLALLAMPWLGSFFWLGGQNVWMFLLCLTFLYLPSRLLMARCPPLKRFFLFTEQVAEEVSEAAMAAFYGQRLDATKERNGVLLFISVLERRVFILADQGVDDKVDSNRWHSLVADLTTAIRHGQRGPAVCRTIGEIGALMREHFPIGEGNENEGDENELHDLIIVP